MGKCACAVVQNQHFASRRGSWIHFLYFFIEPPIGTTHCERLYGIFADAAKCDVFWNCWNGEASRYQCSPGLAYDREARVCMWADQVPECKNEGLN